MHLVVDQVVQLENVHIANSHRTIKRIAGTAVIELGLTGGIQASQLKHSLHLSFLGTIEDRCCHGNATTQVVAQLENLFISQTVKVNLEHFVRVIVDLVQQLAKLSHLTLLIQHAADPLTQTFRRSTKMSFKDLTNVHPRRYTERVQNDIDGIAKLVVGHVFNRHNRRDNTLVTVTASHLVARLNTTLDCQVNLNNLEYARSQIVALLKLALLVVKASFVLFLAILEALLGFLQQLVQSFVFHAQLEPVGSRQFRQVGFFQLRTLFQARTTDHFLTFQSGHQTLERRTFNNAVLVFQVLTVLVQLLFLDRKRTGIFLNTVTGEDLNVNDRTTGTGRHTLRRVLNVRRFFTKDGTQQLFFRGQLGFAFRRYLTNQNVAGAHFSADVDNAGLIQLGQCAFTHVRNICGDFFAAQLGITSHTGQFLNVDGGQTIFLNHFLGDENGVLKVVTVPGHERDAHVLAQSQLTQIHRRTIRQYIATGNHVTLTHDRTLVDTGVLVGAGVLGEVIDIHTCITGFGFFVVDANHDTGRIHAFDHTTATRGYTHARVLSHRALNTGTHQRHLRLQGRDRLTLHVRTHQGPVGIVVLQERDQRRRDRYNLARRYVHEVNRFRRRYSKFVLVTHRNQLVSQTLAFIGSGAGLSDHVVALFNRREVNHLVGHHTINHLPVRTLKEAVGVGPGVGCQRVNQTDVRAFRSFDRAHAAVVGRMYVTDFEASAFTGQTTWAQRGNTTLVGNLGQRVVLIHELGQLTGAKELFHSGRNRLGVDQVLRHQAFAFGETQTLTNRTLNTHQTNTELVFGHFTHATHTTVAQVINVIHLALAVTNGNQSLQYVDDIVVRQRAFAGAFFPAQATIQLHPANGGQIVTLFGKEQVVKQILRRFLGRRLARAHHAVDFHQRFERGAGRVDTQGIRHERTAIQVVGVQGFNVFNTGIEDLGNHFLGQFGVAFYQHFAGRLINHVLGQDTTVEILGRYFQLGDTGFFQLLDVTGSYPAAFFNNHVAVIVFDVEGCDIAPQTAWYQLQLAHFRAQAELTGFKEHLEHLLGGIAQTTQQNGGGQLTTAVDTNEHGVLRIELEVQPGPTVRNHPG